MIYLIDDKIRRQEENFNWDQPMFSLYKNVIIPIHTFKDLAEKRNEILSPKNTVLFHESFSDKLTSFHDINITKNRIEDFAKSNPSFNFIVFSGSKNFRSITNNVGHLPVSVLYENLKLYCDKTLNDEHNLNYLVYGEDPDTESQLIDKLENALSKIKHETITIPNSKNLYLSTAERFIENPINNAREIIIYDEESDEELSNFIKKNLNSETFDNIFIPLCFGKTLSDYNGLRFATHLRCTKSLNQFSRIFIYSFVGLEYLLQNEYFNILKTKNTSLIDFSKSAMGKAVLNQIDKLNEFNLYSEISKLNLNIPSNYYDSHSVANDWAIYRWSQVIDAEDEAINNITSKINYDVYFKYLQTIYPINKIDKLSDLQLKIKFSTNSKILYIDDDADKGWYEILCNILHDKNNLSFDYLGVELKTLTKNEIIEITMTKIMNQDIDIVILDYRLHESDFFADINDITGIILLQKIKEFNPGIQVIMFSATNKIWNFQSIREAGADGFILKESPLNTSNEFTKSAILNFVNVIQNSIDKSFLKLFFQNQLAINSALTPRKSNKHHKPLDKKFVDEILKWLNLSNDVFNKEKLNDLSITTSFILKFSVLENIANKLIDIDNPIEVETKANDQIKKYMFQFRSTEKFLRNFIEKQDSPGNYQKSNKPLKTGRNLPWRLKILNAIDFITDEKLNDKQLSQSIQKRNDLIHANQTTGNKVDISIEDVQFLDNVIKIALENIV